ncbi:CAP domain-containing protein [Streptomyces microflavus]|uniref:SCP domain-containing protein n=1 Tax=Streptomyces microflavus TaxID=1919 RepID=A0A7H8MYA1_STRMI|nr:CAP domain-containing protein [Streptomyces microflavus]QKW47142.1 hypothetical protein HUT09_33935 [Streptomyces microflavus]
MTSACVVRRIALAAAFTAAALTCAPPASAETTEQEKSQVLSLANPFRSIYSAEPLVWGDALSAGAEQAAKACEEVAPEEGGGQITFWTAGGKDNRTAIKEAFQGWKNERTHYTPENPVFSAAYDGFTQLVWKSSTHINVAVAQCPAGSLASFATTHVVARFSPAGNVKGKFRLNVHVPQDGDAV